MASDNVPERSQDRDMLRAGVGKARDPIAPHQAKKLVTQQLQEQRLVCANECTTIVPHDSVQMLVVSQQGHVDGMRGQTQPFEELKLELARTREVLTSQVDCLKTVIEARDQTISALQMQVKLLLEGQGEGGSGRAPRPTRSTVAPPGATDKGKVPPPRASASHGSAGAGPSRGPAHMHPPRGGRYAAKAAPQREAHPDLGALPFQEVQRRLDAHQRLHNVVVMGVRACPLHETPTLTTQQVVGAGLHMPAGVRIRRLARRREGSVSGPVLVICRSPDQAFMLLRDINNVAVDSGLRARKDLSLEERDAKAARRRLNTQFQDLVQGQGLNYQWRGPMRTQLWVAIPTSQGIEWQHIPPGAPEQGPTTTRDS